MYYLPYPLFGCVIDWIMRRTMADKWTKWIVDKLEDDLAALSTALFYLQEKTDRLSRLPKQVGLPIKTSKTQVMCIYAIC